MITRREFIQTTAAASVMLGELGKGLALPTTSDDNWFDRPMRWAQLNLTEDDPARMDLPFWLDYFSASTPRRLPDAGGVVAFYPTEIPFHHRSQWPPGHEAFLSGLIDGCREQAWWCWRASIHMPYQDVL